MSRPASSSPPSCAPRRILVLRPGERLGNAVLGSGLVAGLRARFPETDVDWLLAARLAPLFADNPHRVNLLPFDKRSLFTRPGHWLRFMAALRRRAYDTVIDAGHVHAPSRTALWLMRLSAAKQRVGHEHPQRRHAYTHPVRPETDAHDSVRQHGLLAAFGALSAPAAPPWVSPAPPDKQARVDAWLREKGLLRPVLLWPGSRKTDRRLALSLWEKLLVSLGNSAEFVLGWGPGEEETAAYLSERLGLPRLLALDPQGLAAFCTRACAYIGHDTGPLHLAVACGCATACLYPPGSEASRWAWPAAPHLGLALDEAALPEALDILTPWLAARYAGDGA